MSCFCYHSCYFWYFHWNIIEMKFPTQFFIYAYTPENLEWLTCFILWSAIFTVSLWWTFLFLLLKIIKLVFPAFNDNLFAASHNVTFSNSWFMVLLKVFTSWWLRKRFVSSAIKIKHNIPELLHIYHWHI